LSRVGTLAVAFWALVVVTTLAWILYNMAATDVHHAALLARVRSVAGRVEAARLELDSVRMGYKGRAGFRIRTHVALRYHYVVDGASYVGGRLNFAERAPADPEEARALVESLLAQPDVSVYYDPLSPGESALDTLYFPNRESPFFWSLVVIEAILIGVALRHAARVAAAWQMPWEPAERRCALGTLRAFGALLGGAAILALLADALLLAHYARVSARLEPVPLGGFVNGFLVDTTGPIHVIRVRSLYRVPGEEVSRQGGQWRVGFQHVWSAASAEAEEARYPQATTHPMWYDPQAPERAVLSREPGSLLDAPRRGLLALAAAVLLACAWSAGRGLRATPASGGR
jgi:hypothetical protein